MDQDDLSKLLEFYSKILPEEHESLCQKLKRKSDDFEGVLSVIQSNSKRKSIFSQRLSSQSEVSKEHRKSQFEENEFKEETPNELLVRILDKGNNQRLKESFSKVFKLYEEVYD